MNRPSNPQVDVLVVLRGLAIAGIVFNHAHQGPEPTLGYGGGMNTLMAISGYNLARFGLRDRTAFQFQASCLRLITGILLPTLCVMAAISVVEHIPVKHWLFIGNWFTWEHPAMLHIWYVEVIVQLFIGMIVLFTFSPVSLAFREKPWSASVLLCLAGLGLLALSVSFWNPADLKGRLPQFFLWNLSLGMAAFFAFDGATPGQRLHRGSVIIVLTLVGVSLQYGPERLNFWWLLAAIGLWLLKPRLALPLPVGRVLTIFSQAAFTVYLTHAIFLWAYRRAHLPGNVYLQFAFALLASVTLWVVVTSVVRAYRRVGGPTLIDWSLYMEVSSIIGQTLTIAGGKLRKLLRHTQGDAAGTKLTAELRSDRPHK